MKTKFSYLVLLLCTSAFVFSSCNSEDYIIADQDNQKDIKADIQLINGNTLQFKNQIVYDSIVGKIASMKYEERKEFFNKLGFKSVNQTLAEADRELEVISSLETKVEFDNQYLAFKKKYGKIFLFNDKDNTDLSPYPAYVNPQHELISNSDGYFYINSQKIVAPKYDKYSDKINKATYVSLRSNSTQNNSKNHAWSHQSKRKVGLYISIDGDVIWTTFTSQKKNFWGWNRYSTVYEAAFKLNGGFHYYYNTPNGVRKENKNDIRLQISTGEQDGNFTMALGHLHTENLGPVLCRYKSTGYMEVWSRGVSYSDRGIANVDLCN